MTREARFRLWIVCVVGLLVAVPCSDSKTRWAIAAVALAGFLTGSLALLILTTPPDAIRLVPVRSVVLITLGTLWLLLFQVILVQPRAWSAAVGFALVAAIFAWTLTRLRTTPWWVPILAWNPLFLGPIGLRLTWATAALAVVAIAVSLIVRTGRRELTL